MPQLKTGELSEEEEAAARDQGMQGASCLLVEDEAKRGKEAPAAGLLRVACDAMMHALGCVLCNRNAVACSMRCSQQLPAWVPAAAAHLRIKSGSPS